MNEIRPNPNHDRTMMLVIAIFDVGSHNNVPYTYSCGIPAKDVHACGDNDEMMLVLLRAVVEKDPLMDHDEIEFFDTDHLLTFLYFDTQNDLPGIIANDINAEAKYLGDINEYNDVHWEGRPLWVDGKLIPDSGRHPRGGVELLLLQCSCGFHMAIDATFVEQVGDFNFNCPACGKVIKTAEVFPE